jgi:phospholipase/carboxylesterase
MLDINSALVLQQPSDAARQLVLLLHGYGADAEDLRPVGERLAAEYPQALVVSLRAPQPTAFGFGYQWFAIDDVDDDRRVERVARVMPGFVAAVRHWQQVAQVGPEGTVLIGFSQGAIMVLEAAALGGGTPLAGRVVALAGRYATLPPQAPADTTVFLVHGQADSVMPHRHTVEGSQHLLALGADVVADVLPGIGHEINDEILDLVVRRLKTHVPKRHWEAAMRAGVPPAGGGVQ